MSQTARLLTILEHHTYRLNNRKQVLCSADKLSEIQVLATEVFAQREDLTSLEVYAWCGEGFTFVMNIDRSLGHELLIAMRKVA